MGRQSPPSEPKRKSSKDLGDKVWKETTELAKAFSELIRKYQQGEKWRFTYSVSLSAEPIVEKETVFIEKDGKKNDK